MTYTINKLAKLAGVTVRTLHHYDEIGLLHPSHVGENGYRYYEEKELIRLQQILFFRELEFSLTDIKAMLESPSFDPIVALEDQRKLLELEKKRLNGLLKTITNSIKSMKNNTKQKDDELYGGLTKQQMEDYKQEVREKWGDKHVRQSEERTRHWTKADYDRIAEDGKQHMRNIVAVMDKGPESDEVQALIEISYQGMQQFYDCTYEIFRNLGQMYVDDKRFTAYYDEFHPDLAVFMRDAMKYYSDKKESK